MEVFFLVKTSYRYGDKQQIERIAFSHHSDRDTTYDRLLEHFRQQSNVEIEVDSDEFAYSFDDKWAYSITKVREDINPHSAPLDPLTVLKYFSEHE